MTKKDAIVNNFHANEAVATETIKKGKYRVFNGSNYDVVYLQTSADQVIESDSKSFVSQTEKNTWNKKADGNHNHDTVYAKIGVSYTKQETDGFLNKKANLEHGHAASNITQDSSHRFVTDAEKTRWNNTYTKEELTSKIQEVNDAITTLDAKNTSALATLTQEYKNADKDLEDKVTTVQSNLETEVTRLTDLINSGGTANHELATKVAKIENVTIPGITTQISNLNSKFTESTDLLKSTKADKVQVTSDINAAKNALQTNINAKADQSYVEAQLELKANADNVYSKTNVDDALKLKANQIFVETQLGLKVDKTTFNNELGKKANSSDVTTSLAQKADVTALESGLATKAEKNHEHATSHIKGLGSAATKNVGTGNGHIPILNAQGKLETSVLPSIAVNDKFTADNATEAMKITMEIGDILILTNTAREAAIEKQEQGKAVTYQVAKVKSYQELSDEYTTYIAAGKMTYLCVDPTAEKFEDRFKPLQSSGDTISKAEVNTALASKVSTTVFDSYKSQVTTDLGLKADKSDTYTKAEVNTELDKKVTKETGKQLSTHDFTTAFKTKLEGIEVGANKYVHPSGDGNLHVPETGTGNSGKFLMAGSSAGSLSWVKPNTGQIDETANRKFVTQNQINTWNSKADGNHDHAQYRLISDSFSKSDTTTAINKLKTIISRTMPSSGTHITGAVWIEEIV